MPNAVVSLLPVGLTVLALAGVGHWAPAALLLPGDVRLGGRIEEANEPFVSILNAPSSPTPEEMR